MEIGVAPRTPTRDRTMSPAEYKVWENRLRRMAHRQGLQLQKSRARDPRALDYGTYGLVDRRADMLIAGSTDTGFGLSLDEIERALTEDSIRGRSCRSSPTT